MMRRSPMRRVSEARAAAARKAGSTFTRPRQPQTIAPNSGSAAAAKGTSRRESFTPKVAKLIDERDSVDGERFCVHCGSPRDLERHHRRLRQSGGDPRAHTDCPCNGVTLCRDCHYWAHVLNRREAEAEGLILSSSVTEPWAEALLVHTIDGGFQVFHTCPGARLPEAPAQRRAS